MIRYDREFVLSVLADLNLSALLLLSGNGHRLHERTLSLGITMKQPVAYHMRLFPHFAKERSRILQLLQLDLEHRISIDEVVASFTHVVKHLD